MNIQTDDVSYHKQFNEVYTSFAALDVGYERLVSTERFGKLSLGYAFRAPLFSQRRRYQLLTL